MKDLRILLRFSLVTLAMVGFTFATAVSAQAVDGLQVEGAAICQNVVDREPVDAGSSFPVSIGRLYCFTRIIGAESPTEVTHVWYFGDAERARVTLSVGGSNWRTYSSKIVQEHEVGAWRVEVLDTDGNTLETVEFEIVKQSEAM